MSTHTEPLPLTVSRFDYSRRPEHTGDRGTLCEAETRFRSGRVFSTRFPSVWVTDNGEVELGELRAPAADVLAWLRAIVDHIDARLDAGTGYDWSALPDRLEAARPQDTGQVPYPHSNHDHDQPGAPHP